MDFGNENIEWALENIFSTHKTFPLNPMEIITWLPVRQQNLTTNGIFGGSTIPNRYKLQSLAKKTFSLK